MAWLAWRDAWHEPLLTACSILTLAAILAPLLVLFGVKHGVITTMSQRLIQDPRNREIIPVGSGDYTPTWLEQARARPGVAFLMPQTRSIAATMSLSPAGREEGLLVDLVATGPGDPLLAQWARVPRRLEQVVLSQEAARRLGVEEGSKLRGRVGRRRGRQLEQAELELVAAGVLPAHACNREAAFVLLPLLEATEDFRDGLAVPELGWPGAPPPPGPRVYPSFRMYAASIYDVPELEAWLEGRGLRVHTRAEEIQTVQRLDSAFGLVFALIAGVAVAGFVTAAASRSLAEVKRKERSLGVLRLLGFAAGEMVWFPLVQAGLIGLAGAVVAAGFHLGAAGVINRVFGAYLAAGEYVCRLDWLQLAAAGGLAVAVSVAASLAAAWRMRRIQPSEAIREA
jgi:putative ABC transport system permease protein